MTEKASNIQIAGDHYRKFAIQPSEFIQRNGLNWCEGNVVKYVSRHASKNGVQDLDKAIHYINLLKEWQYGANLPAVSANNEPVELPPPAREPLDLRLPSYALPCTLDEIRAKLAEEICEWRATPADSMEELLEAWDCVQVAQTYDEHGGAASDEARLFLEACHNAGRPVMKARRITMVKLAARAKYSPEDCARILADV